MNHTPEQIESTVKRFTELLTTVTETTREFGLTCFLSGRTYEQERIVKWLRRMAGDYTDREKYNEARQIADLIEKGV